MLVRTTDSQVIDGLQTDRVEGGRGAFRRHVGKK